MKLCRQGNRELVCKQCLSRDLGVDSNEELQLCGSVSRGVKRMNEK